jgi:hypothetical protein
LGEALPLNSLRRAGPELRTCTDLSKVLLEAWMVHRCGQDGKEQVNGPLGVLRAVGLQKGIGVG